MVDRHASIDAMSRTEVININKLQRPSEAAAPESIVSECNLRNSGHTARTLYQGKCK
jgi:hypothetical protein